MVSGESTRNRGIFHTKNETLACDGYYRVHILCGESLCSHTSSYLKIGTTALVVAMIEAGVCQTEAVQLRYPLNAMRAFAADPRCAAKAALKIGHAATAIEIQRHYLQWAEANLRREFMPDWAEDVCREWRRVLDRLESDPASLSATLDWAIKHSLVADRLGKRGMQWKALRHWNRILTWLQWAQAATGCGGGPLTVELVLGSRSPLRDEVKSLTPYLADLGFKWDDMIPLMHLRQELFEIDMRFAQIGEKGIFASLDRAGLLSHRLARGCDVRAALTDPPQAGRARLRGEFVRRHARRRGRYYADWKRVLDYGRKRILDLSNPLETEERWRDWTAVEAKCYRSPELMDLDLLLRPPSTRDPDPPAAGGASGGRPSRGSGF